MCTCIHACSVYVCVCVCVCYCVCVCVIVCVCYCVCVSYCLRVHACMCVVFASICTCVHALKEKNGNTVPKIKLASERTPQQSIDNGKGRKWPICLVFSYSPLVTRCYKR